jgi:hypothetical protein
MARATGTDLGAAAHEGQISPQDWAQMVTNCRGCACAEKCATQLANDEAHSATHPATPLQAPQFCENRASFDHLQKDQGKATLARAG